eukprot:2306826-Prorocentrum_lima.AAC.1
MDWPGSGSKPGSIGHPLVGLLAPTGMKANTDRSKTQATVMRHTLYPHGHLPVLVLSQTGAQEAKR